jgi:cytochrome c
VKPIHRSSHCHLLAALVGLALACQLPGGNNRESKARSTSSARPALSMAPKAPEAGPVPENTTAAASDDTETEAAPEPCAATEFNYPAVKAACADGGRKAVKKIMHGAIAKAKSAGTELKCSNCHMDQTSFGLRPNAVDDLAQWLSS